MLKQLHYISLLCISLLCIALAGAVGCGRQTSPPPDVTTNKNAVSSPTQKSDKFKHHNVIFVSFDALQAAHVGCLGYERDVTPQLDKFASKSHRFTRASSVSSWTVPASMTWFTGVYPSEHRMTNKFAMWTPEEQKLARLSDLSPDLLTLADILKANGYATGGFTGNAGVSGGFGYEQGFDVYYFPKNTFGKMEGSIPRAVKWLKENKDRKFFLFLHGYDVHGQSTPTDGYDYRYVDKDYDGKYTGTELEQEILREEGLDQGALTMREDDVRFWRAIYDEKINRTDERFGQFLAELEKLDLIDNTLFILTSDHGTEFYEHRRFDHGFTLYEELLHVPLFIRLPGQTEGQKIDRRVSSIDVMPTILNLLDVDIPEKAQAQLRGKSLASALNGNPVQRDLFAETDYRKYTYKRSITTPAGWKLIYTLENDSRELYDLNLDPGELKNLADMNSKRADELQQKLFAHFKNIGHDLTIPTWKQGLNPVYPSQGKKPPPDTE